LLADGSGTNISNGNGPLGSFTYDPFGNPLPGSHDPQDTDSGSFGYEGGHMKFTETDFALTPIQMGARAYLPSIGRFTSMDPVPGGNVNAYAYPLDPVNFSDVSGMCMLQCTASVSYFQPAAPVTTYQNTISTSRIQAAATAVLYARPSQTATRAQAPAHQEDTLRYAAPSVTSSNIANIKNVPLRYTAAPAGGDGFNLFNAASSASDYSDAGEVVGTGVGCVIGAGAISFIAGPEVAEGGCIVGSPIGAAVGKIVFGIAGFIEGGYNLPNAETFDH
jgi:RHS repeat-associated protein